MTLGTGPERSVASGRAHSEVPSLADRGSDTPGLTGRDVRRIERFVRIPPNRRNPRMLVPTAEEGFDDDPAPGTGPETSTTTGRWSETGG